MNGLVQFESTLIGSKNAVAELSKCSDATLLVVSDSHGEKDILEQILLEFGADSDVLVFCGDGFYDVMELIEEAYTNEKLRACLPPVIACVQGNGDISSKTIKIPENKITKDSITGFREYSIKKELAFTVAGRVVFLVHGNRHCVDSGVEMLSSAAFSADADLVFFGHTHRRFRDDIGGTLFLNPGSIARPRGGQEASFSIVSFPGENERYDVESFCITKNVFGNCEFIPLGLI
ncbi:MAG: hypothetical protein BKP49_03070 [Treponema sp. CETP13]|nr:MAG: hypothetical protein BKP49_03070 [Treponema sp. CETP13]